MISVPQFRQNFGYFYQGEPVLQASWQSGFNTISSVGQFFGGFMCSYIADRFGRRAALLVGIMFVAGGIFGEVFATANGAFLVGKMILGFGLGFYLTVGPMYCSEVGLPLLAHLRRLLIKAGVSRQTPWYYDVRYQLWYCDWPTSF